ncbi:MAG: flippase-like domain-containing protein, partial [Symploca sp. SIO1C4]|nr:flippase-like domain-containing protein [Symploca sp. SIO1C4]
MTTNKKHLILTTTKCSVAVALLFWVLRKTNLTEIFLAAKDTNIPLLMAALFIYFLSYYIRSHRWRLLLRAQGVNASIPDLLKSYMVGIFFSNFLPSTLGGDAVRVYDAWQLGASKSRAVATVIVDRFLGLLGLMLFAVGSLLFAQ